MKKYLAAGGVAVVAFAFAASAASLDVNAGTLQVGQATDLTCADEANVGAWGYRDSPLPVLVEYVDIDLVGNECDNGEALHVILLNADGSELARGNATNNPKAYATLTADEDRYRFQFTNVDPEAVEGIRIGIDQGHGFYTY